MTKGDAAVLWNSLSVSITNQNSLCIFCMYVDKILYKGWMRKERMIQVDKDKDYMI